MGTRQGPVPTPRLGRECRATPHGMGLQAACWLCITSAAKLSSCVCMRPGKKVECLQVCVKHLDLGLLLDRTMFHHSLIGYMPFPENCQVVLA